MLTVLGSAVVIVGLGLSLTGTVMAWDRERSRKKSGGKGVAEEIDALGRLAVALSKHPVSIRLVFLGIALVLVGATMLVAGTLVS